MEDSFLLQRNTLDSLNMERIKNLKNKKISKEIFPFRQGNFVLLKLDIATENGSKANITPKFRDVYKIQELYKNGFGLKLINLRTGAIKTCSHEKCRLLTLKDPSP